MAENDEIIGKRLPDTPMGRLADGLEKGVYWKVVDNDGEPLISVEPGNLTHTIWYVAAPMSYGYALGRLTKHTVREHEDGTISIKPGDGSSNSVLITGHDGEQWHGYIDHGKWQSA